MDGGIGGEGLGKKGGGAGGEKGMWVRTIDVNTREKISQVFVSVSE